MVKDLDERKPNANDNITSIAGACTNIWSSAVEEALCKSKSDLVYSIYFLLYLILD
jgi:hypothetical protein